jgi:hypothetical protein
MSEVCIEACQDRLAELMAEPRLWPAGEYSAPADDYMLGGRWLFPGGPLPPIGSTAYVDPVRTPWIPESYGAPWPRWQEYDGIWQLERFDGSQIDLLTSQGVPWWIRAGFMALGGGIGSVLRIRVLDQGARWITHAYMPGFPAYGQFQRPELGFSTAYIFPVNLNGRGFSTEVCAGAPASRPFLPAPSCQSASPDMHAAHASPSHHFTQPAHTHTSAPTLLSHLNGRSARKSAAHPVQCTTPLARTPVRLRIVPVNPGNSGFNTEWHAARSPLTSLRPLASPHLLASPHPTAHHPSSVYPLSSLLPTAQVPLLGHERLTGAYETTGPMWASALAGGGHLAQR